MASAAARAQEKRDTALKVKAEQRLEPQLRSTFKEVSRTVARTVADPGGTYNEAAVELFAYELLSPVLNTHYDLVMDEFGHHLGEAMSEPAQPSDMEEAILGALLLSSSFEESDDQARRVASSVADESTRAVRVAEADESSKGSPFTAGAIAGNVLFDRLTAKVTGTSTFQTQRAAESAKQIEFGVLNSMTADVEELPEPQKEWVSQGDNVVRSPHLTADGQLRPASQPFRVMGQLLNHPTDTSLGATAANVANCRCDSVVNARQLDRNRTRAEASRCRLAAKSMAWWDLEIKKSGSCPLSDDERAKESEAALEALAKSSSSLRDSNVRLREAIASPIPDTPKGKNSRSNRIASLKRSVAKKEKATKALRAEFDRVRVDVVPTPAVVVAPTPIKPKPARKPPAKKPKPSKVDDAPAPPKPKPGVVKKPRAPKPDDAPAPGTAASGGVTPTTPASNLDEWDARNLPIADDLARDANLTREQFIQRLQRDTEEMVEAADVYVRVQPRGLQQILDDGRFKSQFETGKSAGVFDPRKRSQVESRLFGAADDLADAQRPVYGYLSTTAESSEVYGKFGALESYGEIRVKLKSSVKSRATWNEGDSFHNLSGDAVKTNMKATASPVLQPSHRSRRLSRGTDPDFDSIQDTPFEYSEVQVWGGVKVDDIEEVFFEAVDIEILEILEPDLTSRGIRFGLLDE